jgi:hypothetical protein
MSGWLQIDYQIIKRSLKVWQLVSAMCGGSMCAKHVMLAATIALSMPTGHAEAQ